MHYIRIILARQGMFFVLTVLGLIAITVIWLIPTLAATRASASVFSLTVAERIQSEINGSLGNALNNIIGVSGEVADEPERTIITFKNLLRYHSIFTNISLVDRSGEEFVRIDSSGPLPPEKFINQSKNTSFYLALQGRTAFTSPIISPNGEPHVTLVIPVPKKGEFVDNVIIAELNVQNLLSIIRSPNIGRGHVYVLDRDGFEILHPDLDKILQHQNFISRSIVKKVLVKGATANGLAADDRYINENGEDTFTVGVLAPVVKWGIFVEQPRSQALAGERQTIVLAIVTFLLATIIFLVIARTTVKLRELSTQLAAANEQLKKLDQTKSEFMSIASHQLRAPLTVIRGFISLVVEGTLGVIPKQAREALQKAAISAEQLVKLVSDLLDLSRMESGKIEYSFEMNDLKQVIEGVLDRVREHAKEKNLAVRFDVQDTIPPFYFDRDKFSEIVMNLTDNAIKYSPGGTIIVTQELITKASKKYACVSVKDTGIGIAREDLPRLFGKFIRAQEAKTIDPNGMGLGLYFVKRVAEDHGGAVWAESKGIGKGSTFFAKLPIRLTPPPPVVQPSQSQ